MVMMSSLGLVADKRTIKKHTQGETRMIKLPAVATLCAISIAAPFLAANAASNPDEAKIRALEKKFSAAVVAKDVDAIMSVYVPDDTLVVFDVTPPRQYVGAKAYRKDWTDYLATLKGPVKFDISDLSVAVNGTMGWSRSIQRVSGTVTNGQPIDLTARVTDIYRKINGNWLIVHEHVSVPVDLDSGKPDLSSKP
jgi:ketosteroid isomerase-like protein